MNSLQIFQRILDDAAPYIFDWVNLTVDVSTELFDALAIETGQAPTSTAGGSTRCLRLQDGGEVWDAGDVDHARVFVQGLAVFDAPFFRSGHERLAWLAEQRREGGE